MSQWVKVASAEEFAEGDCRRVEVGGEPVALARISGRFHAIHNTCLHRGGPLADGTLDGRLITCPWHFWQFDVTTGKCDSVEGMSVRRYEVRVEDGQVLIAT